MAIELEHTLPKGEEHIVRQALIEAIDLEKLVEGECIIFGDKLVIVAQIQTEELKVSGEGIEKLYKIQYFDITTGRYNAFRNMPKNTLFHRVLEASVVVNPPNPSEHVFKRNEVPIKYRPVCAICGNAVIGDNWNESQGVVIHNDCLVQDEAPEEEFDDGGQGEAEAEAYFLEEECARAEDDARRADESGHDEVHEEPPEDFDGYNGCGEQQ